MDDVLTVVFTALLAFHVADYALARALVKDPVRVVVAVVFALVLIVLVGALPLVDIVK